MNGLNDWTTVKLRTGVVQDMSYMFCRKAQQSDSHIVENVEWVFPGVNSKTEVTISLKSSRFPLFVMDRELIISLQSVSWV